MAPGHGDAHAQPHAHVHHISPSPIVVGLGVFLMYMGFAMGARDVGALRLTAGSGAFLAGVLVFLGGIVAWVREDMQMWRDKQEMHGVRPGRPLGWWGMMLFLGTELTLFGTLFASFFVARDDAPLVWAAAREHIEHALPLVTVNTAILVASGFVFHFGLTRLRKRRHGAFVGSLVLTWILGAIFLGVQVSEYLSLIGAGVTLSASQFGSIFYMLTGTHAFHVFLGLVMILVLIVRGAKGQFTPERHVAVDAIGIYWHFVDVVWIVLYLVVYVGVI